MGSYDKQPADWDLYADAAWAPRHVIFCNARWEGRDERHDHQTVAEVRACFEAAELAARGIQVWPCGWPLEGRYDDGSAYTYECDAPMWETAPGTVTCAYGHQHVDAQTRAAQGWDYAEDELEASRLRGLGIQAVAMNGGSI